MAIQIKSPRWKNRTVGLASYRLGTIDTDIEILATSKKDGKRLYPHLYTLKTADIKGYPTQNLSSGVVLYLVPISELNIKKEYDR